MGEIFSAAGNIAAAAMQADAIKEATRMQIKALEKQREFVYSELEPGKVGAQSLAADIERAENRLALQGQIDPDLLAARYESSRDIRRRAQELGEGGAARVAEVTEQEALAGVPGMQEAKKRLIDAALQELELGGSLPPDVQAELVKAGLETAGRTTGRATGAGIGGQLLRQIIGTAGLQLRRERQTQAANLATAAQNLETQRQNILQQLFPNLSAVQLRNLGAQQAVFEQANQAVPEAGLGGTDVANIWLARVGATNQLAQSAADAAARGAMGQAQAWQQGLGAAIPLAASALPTTQQTWGWLRNSGNQGGTDWDAAIASAGGW